MSFVFWPNIIFVRTQATVLRMAGHCICTLSRNLYLERLKDEPIKFDLFRSYKGSQHDPIIFFFHRDSFTSSLWHRRLHLETLNRRGYRPAGHEGRKRDEEGWASSITTGYVVKSATSSSVYIRWGGNQFRSGEYVPNTKTAITTEAIKSKLL